MSFQPYDTKIQIELLRDDALLSSETQFQEAGKVIAVGDKVKFVKPGDILYFASWGLSKTPEIDGKVYRVVEECSDFILGKENGRKK
jgi:co-chaperonin GroES (HSP10)